jgi:alkanesulfonate monooxygenase SsuD/methylene tetrahydromethanopterin reductase-like flavin-dependent oxidoreductase (luciferase family)
MGMQSMRFGLDMPNMGACGSAQALADLAAEAEEAGWDAIFVWDSVYGTMSDPRNDPTCDPWIALTAIAACTRRIRFGTMVTPLTRRRPWKLVRETVTLDHFSGGRLILPVGLGSLDDGAFSKTGEITDRKIRARRLDEGLEILNGLWSGKPFEFSGEHFQMDEMAFLPKPYQSPRIPVWVVGAWPRKLSMQRAARWDGILPAKYSADGQSLAEEGNALAGGMTPADIREMKAYIDALRSAEEIGQNGSRYDIVIEGDAPGEDPARAAEIIGPYVEAGATWWLEALWKTFYRYPGEIEILRKRIRQGPPRF